jgi:hypothetical protein
MAGTEGFLELAGIAGVFVGFGALIAVRGGGASGALEVGYMRGMVSSALLAVVAALAPATLGRYGLPEHGVWALSGAVVLVGWLVFAALNFRTPEFRANIAAQNEEARWVMRIVDRGSTALFLLAALVPPIVVLLGVAPDLDAALYFTAVVVILLMAASLLLGLAYSQRSPAGG